MTTHSEVKNKDITYWINTVITVVLMFGIGYLDPWGTLEPIGMKVLGIFIGLLWGWTTIGFVWPSMLGVLALGLSGYQTVNQVLMAVSAPRLIQCYAFFYLFLLHTWIKSD